LQAHDHALPVGRKSGRERHPRKIADDLTLSPTDFPAPAPLPGTSTKRTFRTLGYGPVSYTRRFLSAL
jgi:hypothetical protein